jgi:hypothetical protein
MLSSVNGVERNGFHHSNGDELPPRGYNPAKLPPAHRDLLKERELAILTTLYVAGKPLKGRSVAVRMGVNFHNGFRAVVAGLVKRGYVVRDSDHFCSLPERPPELPADLEPVAPATAAAPTADPLRAVVRALCQLRREVRAMRRELKARRRSAIRRELRRLRRAIVGAVEMAPRVRVDADFLAQVVEVLKVKGRAKARTIAFAMKCAYHSRFRTKLAQCLPSGKIARGADHFYYLPS